MTDAAEIGARRRAFRALHAEGSFVLPNPWDAGSARLLSALGFPALATTSSGLAWRHGHADGRLPLTTVLAGIREVVDAVDVPVTADFESGYADDAEGVGRHVRLALETGIAGLSIEDASGVPEEPLLDLDTAVDRLRAARAAVDDAGGGAVLTARAENFVVGRPDLADTLRRLRAYADAGADCLYAPGVRSRADIAAVVSAVAPSPVNVLVGGDAPMQVSELAALGVRRISVGGALARSAWAGFVRAARALADGRFDGFADAVSGDELDAFFGPDQGPPP